MSASPRWPPTTDGFALSQLDLEARREGDVLGRSQSGFHSSLQQLRVLRDEAHDRRGARGRDRDCSPTTPTSRAAPRSRPW